MAYLGRPGATAPLTSADIPDNSITAAKIVTDTIAAGDIGNDAVGTAELANDVVISTSGAITTTGGMTVDGATVFNEASADVDFRVESNGNANMFVVDAGNDRIGIGTATPDTLLHLESSLTIEPTIKVVDTNGDGAGPQLYFKKDGGSAADDDEIGRIRFDADNDANQALQWFNIIAYLADASDGAEKSKLSFIGREAGLEVVPMTINGSQIGIGKASPLSHLDVGNSTTYNHIGKSVIRIGSINNTDVYALYGAGWGGGGTYSPVTFGGLGSSGSGHTKAHFVINTRDSTGDDAPTERFRIMDNGNCCIGTTSSSSKLAYEMAGHSSTPGFSQNLTGSVVSAFYFERLLVAGSTKGQVTTDGSNVSWSNMSDYRAKENIVPMDNSISRLQNLKPILFDWIETSKSSEGFLAHEAQEVVPTSVTGEKDAVFSEVLYTADDELPEGKSIGDVKTPESINPQMMDNSKLIPLLVGALQEAVARIETLESENTALKTRMDALEARVTALEG